jgi:hypothetical protein
MDDLRVDSGNLLISDDLACVPVTIIDDDRIEAQESFSLTLTMDDLDVNISDGTIIVIRDNDGEFHRQKTLSGKAGADPGEGNEGQLPSPFQ